MREPIPFEHVYRAHGGEILGFLKRRLGPEAGEDAFQETMLRALRTYDGLESTDGLRAWLFTIARSVLVDDHRRRGTRPTTVDAAGAEQVAPPPGEPAWRELAPLTASLPRTERAAVVLRYGYDLSYSEIGEALGSSDVAARQAASSGVRRLRATKEREDR